MFNAMGQLTRLRSLVLEDVYEAQDGDMGSLTAALAQLQGLTHLGLETIDSGGRGRWGRQFTLRLPLLPDLLELQLCTYNGEQCCALVQCGTGITRLDLSDLDSSHQPQWAQHMAAIHQFQQLQRVHLDYNVLEHDLLHLSHCSGLRELQVWQFGVGAAVTSLQPLAAVMQLQVISGVIEEGPSLLAWLPTLRHLIIKYSEFYYDGASSGSFERLCGLTSLSSLTMGLPIFFGLCNAEGNDPDDPGLVQLTLQNYPGLVQLMLNMVGGWRYPQNWCPCALGSLLRLTSLELVSFPGPGAADVLSALRRLQLRRLIFCGTQKYQPISDSHLACAVALTQLREVQLHDLDAISAGGLRGLCCSRDFGGALSHVIHGCMHISHADCMQAMQQHPGVNVCYNPCTGK